ncbi:MAG TPA: VOC family protein [Chloroflexota bacterium]|jgi:catechol 2,3-dioxygenase-like lactoylglutathione lyase family enzyme|nr:VOC family protein [Chloroflexota bacterium]
MPKLRHIAIVCQDPKRLAEWYQQAFDMVVVYHQPETGITELSDGDFNLTLLNAAWLKENTGHSWHFGIEMPMEEIEARRPLLEALGAKYHDGVRDGRAVEVYIEDPEGHRIDLAPHWLTRPGERRREPYRRWVSAPTPEPTTAERK